ncbi:predicted protein [Nematostella vectensis]|uniref:PH domain-containing protein n=1 Tax=Nematostella vectensis TaxID=45351 RepID=A7RPT5_NEMVE|nr:predicted protein [Nematostella vectensis]|eukprot:XP_001638624.1 predicted protein [Nematostella vectensis]
MALPGSRITSRLPQHLEGYLTARSKSGPKFPSKKSYFVLQGELLRCYDSKESYERSSKVKGQICLDEVCSISESLVYKKSSATDIIKLVLLTGGEINLNAENNDEVKRWVRGLQQSKEIWNELKKRQREESSSVDTSLDESLHFTQICFDNEAEQANDPSLIKVQIDMCKDRSFTIFVPPTCQVHELLNCAVDKIPISNCDKCQTCQLRCQMMELWMLDNTGQACRLESGAKINVVSSPRHFYLLEHNYKLLVVHFEDGRFSAKPVAMSIKAKQVPELFLSDLGLVCPDDFLLYLERPSKIATPFDPDDCPLYCFWESKNGRWSQPSIMPGRLLLKRRALQVIDQYDVRMRQQELRLKKIIQDRRNQKVLKQIERQKCQQPGRPNVPQQLRHPMTSWGPLIDTSGHDEDSLPCEDTDTAIRTVRTQAMGSQGSSTPHGQLTVPFGLPDDLDTFVVIEKPKAAVKNTQPSSVTHIVHKQPALCCFEEPAPVMDASDWCVVDKTQTIQSSDSGTGSRQQGVGYEGNSGKKSGTSARQMYNHHHTGNREGFSCQKSGSLARQSYAPPCDRHDTGSVIEKKEQVELTEEVQEDPRLYIRRTLGRRGGMRRRSSGKSIELTSNATSVQEKRSPPQGDRKIADFSSNDSSVHEQRPPSQGDREIADFSSNDSSVHEQRPPPQDDRELADFSANDSRVQEQRPPSQGDREIADFSSNDSSVHEQRPPPQDDREIADLSSNMALKLNEMICRPGEQSHDKLSKNSHAIDASESQKEIKTGGDFHGDRKSECVTQSEIFDGYIGQPSDVKSSKNYPRTRDSQADLHLANHTLSSRTAILSNQLKDCQFKAPNSNAEMNIDPEFANSTGNSESLPGENIVYELSCPKEEEKKDAFINNSSLEGTSNNHPSSYGTQGSSNVSTVECAKSVSLLSRGYDISKGRMMTQDIRQTDIESESCRDGIGILSLDGSYDNQSTSTNKVDEDDSCPEASAPSRTRHTCELYPVTTPYILRSILQQYASTSQGEEEVGVERPPRALCVDGIHISHRNGEWTSDLCTVESNGTSNITDDCETFELSGGLLVLYHTVKRQWSVRHRKKSEVIADDEKQVGALVLVTESKETSKQTRRLESLHPRLLVDGAETKVNLIKCSSSSSSTLEPSSAFLPREDNEIRCVPSSDIQDMRLAINASEDLLDGVERSSDSQLASVSSECNTPSAYPFRGPPRTILNVGQSLDPNQESRSESEDLKLNHRSVENITRDPRDFLEIQFLEDAIQKIFYHLERQDDLPINALDDKQYSVTRKLVCGSLCPALVSLLSHGAKRRWTLKGYVTYSAWDIISGVSSKGRLSPLIKSIVEIGPLSSDLRFHLFVCGALNKGSDMLAVWSEELQGSRHLLLEYFTEDSVLVRTLQTSCLEEVLSRLSYLPFRLTLFEENLAVVTRPYSGTHAPCRAECLGFSGR